MNFSKIMKVAAITLPLIAVTACSSNKGTAKGGDLSSADSQALQQLEQTNIVYFDYDKYSIKPQFAKVLNAHAEFLRNNPDFNVVIQGHTDERGTPEYNIGLGERRAKAVKAYLQANGVAEGQLLIVSYGKEKPAVLGSNEAAWAKNRRAVLAY